MILTVLPWEQYLKQLKLVLMFSLVLNQLFYQLKQVTKAFVGAKPTKQL